MDALLYLSQIGVALAKLNASLGQPKHFQVDLDLGLLRFTAAATSDCGCSAALASSKMLYQLLSIFLSGPIGTAAHLAHLLKQKVQTKKDFLRKGWYSLFPLLNHLLIMSWKASMLF